MKDRVGPMISGWLKRARQEALLVVLAVAAGGIAGVLTAVFGRGVLAVTALREAQPWLLVLLPAGGAVIWLAYARWGKECSRGMALVFDAEEGRREDVPLLLVPLAVGATWLGHLLGASVGREGVAVQIASAGASLLTPALQRQQDRRRLLVAGGGGRFCGAVLHPAGGGILRAGTVPRGGWRYTTLCCRLWWPHGPHRRSAGCWGWPRRRWIWGSRPRP